MKKHPGTVVALGATLVAAGMVAGLPTASAARPDSPALRASAADDRGRFLQRPAHGAAAVDRLGEDLDEVAALNEVSPGALKELLLDDAAAWIHPSGLV